MVKGDCPIPFAAHHHFQIKVHLMGRTFYLKLYLQIVLFKFLKEAYVELSIAQKVAILIGDADLFS
jgi:hypothetical protein